MREEKNGKRELKKAINAKNTIPDSCDSRGFRLDSAVNSVIDAIGPIESVTSLRMQLPSIG